MKLSFSGLLVSLAVANARELRALQQLQDAGESDTDVNQGQQDSTSLAEKLRRHWLLDTPTITYEEASNTVTLVFEESTDKLDVSTSPFKEQFYDFKCRDDLTRGVNGYDSLKVTGASLPNGKNGFGSDATGPDNFLWDKQDGIEWDWTSKNPTGDHIYDDATPTPNLVYANPNPNPSPVNGLDRGQNPNGNGCGSSCGWKNEPNTLGNPAGRDDGQNVGYSFPGSNWDANDGKHDFPPCDGTLAPACPGFPKFLFQLTPADVADNVRVYEKVGKHPGVPACTTTECQSRLDPNKKYPKDDEGKGIMRFCVRTNVGYLRDATNDPNSQLNNAPGSANFREVNFLETLVTIKYTLDAGFTIDAFAVEPKEREEVTAIKDSYELEAYLCNPEKRHAQEVGKPPAFPGIDLPHPPTVAKSAEIASAAFCDVGVRTTIDTTADVLCDPGGLRNVPKAITKFNTGSTTEEGEEDYVNAQPLNPLNLTPNPTAAPGASDAFNQGALITVCVRPNADTWRDGVRLASLQTFDWYRDVPAVKQQAIVGGKQAPNMLTAYNAGKTVTEALAQTAVTSAVGQSSNHVDGFIEFPIAAGNIGNQLGSADYTVVGATNVASKQHGLCQDAAEWCTFSSILFADFYKNAGEVFGVGTAFLEFKRRRLGDANKPDGDAARKLQDSGGSSPFDLVVRTNLADDGPGALKTAGGASYGVTLVATAMALLSAALLA